MSNILDKDNDKSVCVLLEKIGQSGIKFLLFLLKYGDSNKNQIRIKAFMGVESVINTALKLYKVGLIIDKPGRGTETLYSLTDKGRRVADLLKQADDILSEGA